VGAQCVLSARAGRGCFWGSFCVVVIFLSLNKQKADVHTALPTKKTTNQIVTHPTRPQGAPNAQPRRLQRNRVGRRRRAGMAAQRAVGRALMERLTRGLVEDGIPTITLYAEPKVCFGCWLVGWLLFYLLLFGLVFGLVFGVVSELTLKTLPQYLETPPTPNRNPPQNANPSPGRPALQEAWVCVGR